MGTPVCQGAAGPRALTSATRSASSVLRMMPGDPGTVGTPALFIVSRAVDLSPMRLICSGRGPMNSMPCSRTISTNVEFSDCGGEGPWARVRGFMPFAAATATRLAQLPARPWGLTRNP